MPRKVKCVQCERGLFEWSMAVKKLPCKHYCHSSCIVALPTDWGDTHYKEGGCCPRCGYKIHRDWLKETLEQQSTYEEVDSKVFYEELHKELSLRALDTIGNRFRLIQESSMPYETEMIRSVTGYIDMLQQIFTLVQQMEENDKRRKTK